MTSNNYQKNMDIKNVATDATDSTDANDSVVDVIVVLDSSGSMGDMGNEPVQAVNAFIEEQKNNSVDDGSTFTLVTFNTDSRVIIDHVPIVDIEPLDEGSYKAYGCTALNDSVCSTIVSELKRMRPKNKIVMIITDGVENSSRTYTTVDTRKMVADCKNNYGWKFIFIGANIDAFVAGKNINVDREQCSQFAQNVPGDLLQMCRQTSCNITDFRRARTEGSYDVPELVAAHSMFKSISYPVDEKEKVRAGFQFRMPIELKRSNAIGVSDI